MSEESDRSKETNVLRYVMSGMVESFKVYLHHQKDEEILYGTTQKIGFI
jgi:hypothetical protein